MMATQKNRSQEEEYVITAVDFYDQWAKHYDESRFPKDYEKEMTCSLCSPYRGQRVLEIGSGTGRITIELLSAGAIVTAVEPAANMCQMLRAKCGHFTASGALTIINATLTQYSPPPGAFDLVVLPMVIDHIPDISALFSLAQSALTESGRLVFSCLNPYYQLMLLNGMVRKTSKERTLNMAERSTTDAIPTYCHFYSDLFRVSRAHGFGLQELKEAIIDEEMAKKYPDFSHHLGYPNLYAISFEKI